MNIRQIITYVIFISLICVTWQMSAQHGYTLVTDTALVTVDREIPDEKIDNYRSQPTYNYDEDPDFSDSLLDRLWLQFKRWLRSLLGESGYGALGKFLYYALIFVAIGAIVVFAIRMQGHNPLTRTDRKTKTALAADLIDENSSVESIDSLIDKAASSGDYRLAIRLHYLKTLKLLDTAEKITWRSGKTNYDYLLEIKDEGLREEFDNLNYIYEYSWYGQFEIESAEQYGQLRDPFLTLYNQIKK